MKDLVVDWTPVMNAKHDSNLRISNLRISLCVIRPCQRGFDIFRPFKCCVYSCFGLFYSLKAGRDKVSKTATFEPSNLCQKYSLFYRLNEMLSSFRRQQSLYLTAKRMYVWPRIKATASMVWDHCHTCRLLIQKHAL